MLLLKENYNGYKLIIRNYSKFAFVQRHLKCKYYIHHNQNNNNNK